MQLTTKTIEYNFDKESSKYKFAKMTATIIFKIDIDGYWQFKECKYNGLSEIYTEEDWDFLKEVADKIKELKKELNK